MISALKAAPVWQPHQTACHSFNGVEFTIENRTLAIVKVVLIKQWIAEEIAKDYGTPYQDLYSLSLNDAHLIVPEQVDSPEESDLAYYFSNISHFILEENASFITLRAIATNNAVKELFLRKHPILNGYVITPYPPKVHSVQTIFRLAKEVLTKNPEVRSRQIAYNDYGAFLWGEGTFWASSVDEEMKPIPIGKKFKNGTFYISNDALNLGIRNRITGHNYNTNSQVCGIFINHFPTQTIELPELINLT